MWCSVAYAFARLFRPIGSLTPVGTISSSLSLLVLSLASLFVFNKKLMI